MSFLNGHLEQIELSCEGIKALSFPRPRMFTNALLGQPNITTLIRDTEPHERALFSVPPPKPTHSAPSPPPESKSSRRQTVFNVESGAITAAAPTSARCAPRRNTAVAAVLGSNLHEQLRKGERRTASDRAGVGGGDVNVEVLLAGVEKLCSVYEGRGVRQNLEQVRMRNTELMETLDYYEEKVRVLGEQLEAKNKDRLAEEAAREAEADEEEYAFTEEDLRREEEEVRQLEQRKRDLMERLKPTERPPSDLRALGERKR